MAFFPVAAVDVSATTSSGSTALPTPGKTIRISRESNSNRCFIKFGSSSVTVTTSTGMELVAGVVESFDLPDAGYTNFALITDTGTVKVNVSVSPKFDVS